MKPLHYAQKRRQLKYLVKKLNRLLKTPSGEMKRQIDKLIRQIRVLAKQLSTALSPVDLKRILGSVAVIIGISFTHQATAQSFLPPVQNPFGLTSADEAAIPAFVDLDSDGDMDLLVGENYGIMQYFQNTGTASNPTFTIPVQNPFGLVATYGFAVPTFADLDADGDMDLLVGERYGAMQYFQNTGTASNPAFATPVQNPFGLIATYDNSLPTFVDLDADGDMDLLVGEYYGNMQYFQNTGTASNPTFAAPVQNPFGLVAAYYNAFPAFADLDGDGDMDLLVGESSVNVNYFENIGTALNPAFATPIQNPFGLTPVDYITIPSFADLDADGDIDLLIGDYPGTMHYFENTSAVGIKEVSTIQVELFPNPTTDIIHITTDAPIDKIELFDVLGQHLATYNGTNTSLNIAHLSIGMYSLKITDSKGKYLSRKIQKY